MSDTDVMIEEMAKHEQIPHLKATVLVLLNTTEAVVTPQMVMKHANCTHERALAALQTEARVNKAGVLALSGERFLGTPENCCLEFCMSMYPSTACNWPAATKRIE